LFHKQQMIFNEENPDADATQSWLSKSTSVTTSASELSSSEASLTSTSASDGDAPTPAKTPKKTQQKEPKRSGKVVSSSDSDATLRKEMKKLQVEAKKAKATADNLKKKMKQDKQALQIYVNQVKEAKEENDGLKEEMKQTKAMQDKIKALEDENKVLKGESQHQPEPELEPTAAAHSVLPTVLKAEAQLMEPVQRSRAVDDILSDSLATAQDEAVEAEVAASSSPEPEVQL
jgi:hypothetical protein